MLKATAEGLKDSNQTGGGARRCWQAAAALATTYWKTKGNHLLPGRGINKGEKLTIECG